MCVCSKNFFVYVLATKIAIAYCAPQPQCQQFIIFQHSNIDVTHTHTHAYLHINCSTELAR